MWPPSWAMAAIWIGLTARLIKPSAIGALKIDAWPDWSEWRVQRLGLHTGVVVVNPPGAASGAVDVPVGETPTVAGQLTAMAPPHAVVVSSTTARLVEGSFEMEAMAPLPTSGDPSLGLAYRVQRENRSQEPLEVPISPALTTFVGRDAELALLIARWTQAQSGWGQVVLVSGEPGIGKSRLIQELNQHVRQAEAPRIVFRCSPQATQSPFYPVIVYLQRLLTGHSTASSVLTLEILEQALETYDMPLEKTVPLLAALLNLPVQPERYAPLQMSAQLQRQRTQEVLIAWLTAAAERQPVLAVFENLHWADPSSLELMGLFLERVQTLPVLSVLSYRPEFKPPWPIRSPFMELVLPRLDASSITKMVAGLAQKKALPDNVIQHVVNRTDGVPLFVEECAKMLLEGEWLQEEDDHYALTRSLPEHEIPITLQDTLLARLDRLSPGAALAKLGAVCGREFTDELIEAVATFDEKTVKRGLRQLVEAELLYQVSYQAPLRYRFKHALIQDVAYQSLLRRERRQLHQNIAQALETQFPETAQSQPELIAHHYKEADQVEPAIVYWQRSAEAAIARSAYTEAIAHLRQGLDAISELPDNSDRLKSELELQIALGTPLAAAQGYGAPEVERVYTRARELSRELGDGPQLFPVLSALALFYLVRGTPLIARELGEQLLQLAEQSRELTHLLEADYLFGIASFWCGDIALARQHVESMIARYDSAQSSELVFCYGQDPRIEPVFYHALTLWLLGDVDQARIVHPRGLSQAQAVGAPLNLAFALLFSTAFHQICREISLTQTQAEAVIDLATEESFPLYLGAGIIWHGWARVVQGEVEDGIAELRDGLSAFQATGAEIAGTWIRALLAEAYGHLDQPEAGRQILAEARVDMESRGERVYEAELYRLEGELLLIQDETRAQEAEVLFRHALDVAQSQKVKAWELRAAVSMSRLWQQQGKMDDAQRLLAEVYHGFTEGVDTADLQEAKALLGHLRG